MPIVVLASLAAQIAVVVLNPSLARRDLPVSFAAGLLVAVFLAGMTVVALVLVALAVVLVAFAALGLAGGQMRFAAGEQVTAPHEGRLRLEGRVIAAAHKYRLPAEVVGAVSDEEIVAAGWSVAATVDGRKIVVRHENLEIGVRRWPSVTPVSMAIPGLRLASSSVVPAKGSELTLDAPRLAVRWIIPGGKLEAEPPGRATWRVAVDGSFGQAEPITIGVTSPVMRSQAAQPVLDLSYGRILAFVGGTAAAVLPIAVASMLGFHA